jgi:hypothetical protein
MEPFPDGFGGITRDLEALKLALIEMRVEDLAASDAKAMAQQISAIRLHLKRLEYDRLEVVERVDAARGSSA